jgi:hypothetical protein
MMAVWPPEPDPERVTDGPQGPPWWMALAALGFALCVGLAAFALTLGVAAGLRVVWWWWP